MRTGEPTTGGSSFKMSCRKMACTKRFRTTRNTECSGLAIRKEKALNREASKAGNANVAQKSPDRRCISIHVNAIDLETSYAFTGVCEPYHVTSYSLEVLGRSSV